MKNRSGAKLFIYALIFIIILSVALVGCSEKDGGKTTPKATEPIVESTPSVECDHVWVDATCEAARTCEECGLTEGEALGHNLSDANCTDPLICQRCDKLIGEARGHEPSEVKCDSPVVCQRCGEVVVENLEHEWEYAEVIGANVCVREGCQQIEGSEIPQDKNLLLALSKIPIANADMTEDELRDIVVEFMRVQLTFAYKAKIADTKYTYYIKNLKSAYGFDGCQITYKDGKYYGGVPYMGNSVGSLYRWMHFYDGKTGEVDWTPIISTQRLNWKSGSTVYPDVGSAVFGNTCASSCFWAWSRVSNSISGCWTYNLIPANGYVLVGDYKLNEWDDHGDSTKALCDENGIDVMYAAYAQVKRADGFVQTGHAVMAVGDAVVVYDENGKIDGDKSYVPIAEQKASFLTAAPSKGGVDLYSPLNEGGLTYRIMGNFWGTVVNGKVKDMEWSFAELYEKGYLPVTVAELVGERKVEGAWAKLTYNGKTVSLGSLGGYTIKSNYLISDVTVTVKNAEGDEVFKSAYASETTSVYKLYSVALSSVLKKNPIAPTPDYIGENLKAYCDGTYTISIACRISTGELLEVFDGTIVN